MIFGFLPQNLKTPRRRLMAFIMSWHESGDGHGAGDAADGADPAGRLARFRRELYFSFGLRRDALFDVADALACGQDRVLMLAELSLEPECRCGHAVSMTR
jgi:hypothetical protein